MTATTGSGGTGRTDALRPDGHGATADGLWARPVRLAGRRRSRGRVAAAVVLVLTGAVTGWLGKRRDKPA